jgi:hypothetical protein
MSHPEPASQQTGATTAPRSGFAPTGVRSVEHTHLNHLILTDIADSDGQPLGASYGFDSHVLVNLLHAHGFNPQHIDRFVDAILRPQVVYLDFDRRRMPIRQEPDATKGAVGRMLKRFLDERRAEGQRARDEHDSHRPSLSR